MKNTFGGWSVVSAVGLSALSACSGPTDFVVDDAVPVAGTGAVPVGTTSPPPSPYVFEGKTQRAAGKVAPIAGGTLLVTKDGYAIAADPDRDSVHVVRLSDLTVRSVPLEEGDEPGRVIDGPSGVAYVAARRGGVVLAVDIAEGTAKRIPVCSAPRGLAFDAATSQLFVACRSGLLAVIDTRTDEVTEKMRLDPDLRDVVLSGENLTVTRFKSAEVLVVNRAGEVLRRGQPVTPSVSAGGADSSVAYRTLGLPGGGVLVGHVNSSNVTLPSGAGAYYGSSCGGSVASMTVALVKETTNGDKTAFTSFASTLNGAAGPIDIGVSPDGARLAVIAAGNSWPISGVTPPNLWLSPTAMVSSGALFPSLCTGLPTAAAPSTDPSVPTMANVPGELTAVAFDAQNKWVVQSREPAKLMLEGGAEVALAADRRFDTGMALFHTNTGGGIACTSCHPEGGEDGHTWIFSAGPRRSQSLEGGASTRAPFHWVGDLGTFDSLIDEVMMRRMSMPQELNPEQRGALRDWLDTVPRSVTADDLDPAAVARGRQLFESAEVGCATCHGGGDFTDNKAHDVGTGGVFVTPSLVGVNLRAPLFHDGCAVSLAARFGPCGGGDAHGTTSQLTKAEEADLVSYMQSL